MARWNTAPPNRSYASRSANSSPAAERAPRGVIARVTRRVAGTAHRSPYACRIASPTDHCRTTSAPDARPDAGRGNSLGCIRAHRPSRRTSRPSMTTNWRSTCDYDFRTGSRRRRGRGRWPSPGSAPSTAPRRAAATSKVSVVHGIPGAAGRRVRQRGEDPRQLPARHGRRPARPAGGHYDIALTKPGEPIGSAILKVDDAAVPGGANISLVAHLDADGQPKITPFVNDVASRRRQGPADRAAHRGRAGRGRARRRQAGLQGPDQPQRGQGRRRRRHGVGRRRAGRHRRPWCSARPTSNLKEGTATIVYAIGSAEDKTLDARGADHHRAALGARWRAQRHRRPGRPRVPGAWWYAVAALGLLLLLVGGAPVRRRSARA